jgi:hypothetical protein
MEAERPLSCARWRCGVLEQQRESGFEILPPAGLLKLIGEIE